MGYQKLLLDSLFHLLRKLKLEKKFFDRFESKIKSYLIDDIFLLDNSINIVFDIGAYLGEFIDKILTKAPHCTIHAFEPSQTAFEALIKKYKCFDNVHVKNLACGAVPGKMKYFISNFVPTNSLLKPNLKIYEELKHDRVDDFKSISELDIEVITINQYSKLNSIGEIDLIKTDTQGYDYQVLLGAKDILKKVKFIVCELHFFPFYENEELFFKICEFLYSNNFYLYSLYNLNKLNYDVLLESDALFINSDYISLTKLKV